MCSSSSSRSRGFGLLAAGEQLFDQLAQHFGRAQVREHRRVARHEHRLAAERLHFDAQLGQQLRMLEHGRRLGGRQIDRLRHQQLLRFQRAAQHLLANLLVQNSLVQRVLVDDLDAGVGFDDQIAVVNLQRVRG